MNAPCTDWFYSGNEQLVGNCNFTCKQTHSEQLKEILSCPTDVFFIEVCRLNEQERNMLLLSSHPIYLKILRRCIF